LIYFGGYGYKLMADPDERSRSFIVHKTLWVEQVEMGWNNEVHIFDPKHSSWSEPQTHGHAPALRAGHASMTIGCKGYICGGRVK
ncbi:Kelch domain-containing protein 1, partial [Larimichthys crocea]